MGTVELIASIVSLIAIILKEFFSAKAAAKKRNEEFKLDQTKFLAFADKAIIRMREDAGRESREAGDTEDRIDDDLRNGR